MDGFCLAVVEIVLIGVVVGVMTVGGNHEVRETAARGEPESP